MNCPPTPPIAGMQAPKVPEEPVPVLSRDQLKALLAACKGSRFAERRDTAIIRDCPHSRVRVIEDRGARRVVLCGELTMYVLGSGPSGRVWHTIGRSDGG